MSTIYILSDYGKLSRQNDALVFSSPSGETRKLFLHQASRLIIAGSVELTGSALRMLMHHQVDTIFLSLNGKFSGKLQFEEGKNVFLRKRQYDSLNNQAFCLTTARFIAEGKLSNQIAFMQRINRKENGPAVLYAITQAQRNLEKMKEAETVEAIRGYEGLGARIYFSVFKQNINPLWAVFKGRSMNPPKVAEKFEEKLESLIFYPPENERHSYQKIIALQVKQFKRVLLGEEETYKAFLIR